MNDPLTIDDPENPEDPEDWIDEDPPFDGDSLPPPDDDPELDFPPPDDDWSLPSINSDDDRFYFGDDDGSFLDDDDIFASYGDDIDDLSDPESLDSPEDYPEEFPEGDPDDCLNDPVDDIPDEDPEEGFDELPEEPPEVPVDESGNEQNEKSDLSLKTKPATSAVSLRNIFPPPPPPLPIASSAQKNIPPIMPRIGSNPLIPPPRPPSMPQKAVNNLAQNICGIAPPRPPPYPHNEDLKVSPRTVYDPKPILNNGVDCSGNDCGGLLEQHPQLLKYFKMLKVGLPHDMVGMKMIQDGYNPQLLQCDIKLPCPAHVPLLAPTQKKIFTSKPSGSQQQSVGEKDTDSGPLVPIMDHPIYGKFFKMLKFGLPKQTIESKLGLEGIDASILNLPTTTFIGTNDLRYHSLKNSKPAVISKPEPPKHKKKKLFLKSVDSKNLGHDSLWVDNDEDANIDIKVDAEEFNKLFVEDSGEVQRRLQMIEEQKRNQLNKLKRSKIVQVIPIKRAQNGAIALARLKMNLKDIKRNIQELHTEVFTTEQLKALLEFLPTLEETDSLSKFKGDPHQELGPAERYMLTMMDFVDANICLQVMIFKQQFYNRWHDCKQKFGLLEATCDEIKSSIRLKKVLKTILKIVNQLHDDPREKCAGISVDSLLKLSTAKAFDKKTSVLQYVIMVIHRHDEDALMFSEDLTHLSDAAKLTLESINSERSALESELLQILQALRGIDRKTKQEDATNAAIDQSRIQSTIHDFESKLKPMCFELSQRYLKLCGKFPSILRYFGEDSDMKCEGFFVPLNKFVLEFESSRIQVEKIRQLELKKLQLQQRKGSQQSTTNAQQSKH